MAELFSNYILYLLHVIIAWDLPNGAFYDHHFPLVAASVTIIFILNNLTHLAILGKLNLSFKFPKLRCNYVLAAFLVFIQIDHIQANKKRKIHFLNLIGIFQFYRDI